VLWRINLISVPSIASVTRGTTGFLHLGTTTSQVCITANRRCSGSEVVIREGSHTIGCHAMERTARVRPAMSGDDVISAGTLCRLPVSRLESLIKFVGASQLPFAEDCPEDGNTTDGRCDGYDEGESEVVLILDDISLNGRDTGGRNFNAFSVRDDCRRFASGCRGVGQVESL